MNGILSVAATSASADSLEGRAVMAAELAANIAGWSLLVSIALLLGAIAAARYARGAWKAARDQANTATSQLMMAKAAEEQREASKVSAWLTMTGPTLEINVLNLNESPVYDVTFFVEARRSDSPCTEPCTYIYHDSIVALPPFEAETTHPGRAQLGRDAYVFDYPDADGIGRNRNGMPNVPLGDESDWVLWDGQATSPGLAIKLSFRDSANVRWHRGWDGTLTRQK